MTEFRITPLDKSLSATDSWVDIDLSSDVPATATGAIFQIDNSEVDSYEWGFRKKGSTDNRHRDLEGKSHSFAIIGVDANRVCQGYIEHACIDFYLVGYTESDAALRTNAADKCLGITGSWQDIDLSSELPSGAVAAIFEVENASITDREYGLRKKGATADRHNDLKGNNHTFFVVGVDGTRKCQGYIEHVSIGFYLVGHLNNGAAETNGVDRSLSTIGSYQDITESNAPEVATGVFGEVSTIGPRKYGGRKKGASYDYYRDSSEHGGYFIGLDGDKKWEGKIENTVVDFYTLGYFFPVFVEKSSSDSGAGADALSDLLATLIQSDSGAGADALSDVIATLIKSDFGAGVGSLGARGLGSSDQGAGADAVSELLATLLKNDSGIGVDALIEIANIIIQSDSGAGADALSDIIATLIKSDGGFGTESLGSRTFNSRDYGQGSESDLVPCIGLETGDSLLLETGQRLLRESKTTKLLATSLETDAGVGTENIAELGLLPETDVGTGTDAILSRLLDSADTGAGADAISELIATFLKSDSGAGIDARSVLLGFLTESDTGAGIDAISELLATSLKSDSGVGAEAYKKAILIFLLLKLFQRNTINITLSQK